MPQPPRDRIKAIRQQESNAARRRRGLVIGGVVLAVLAVAVGVGIAVQQDRAGEAADTAEPPRGTVETFGIPRGEGSAPVTVTLFEDFQCPACRTVEQYIGPVLTEYVEAETVQVVYRPIAFLDDASTTEYSSRALGAAACVLDQRDSDAFVDMHDLLFANQPPERTAGLSDDELVDLAVRAGAEQAAVAPCIEDQRYAGWVDAATEQASQEGVNATPTILVNGEQVELTGGENPAVTLRQAIEAAA